MSSNKKKSRTPLARGAQHILLIASGLVLLSCTPKPKDLPEPELVLQPATFEELPGWSEADLSGFVVAFSNSCTRWQSASPTNPAGKIAAAGLAVDWQYVCAAVLEPAPGQSIRQAIETHLQPVQVLAGDQPGGLFTGYYEASLRGSRERTDRYSVPLHNRPEDLIMVNLGEFREELQGHRIAGRVINGSLKPYESRAQIVTGNWPHEDQVLLWVDDPIEAFFVQIQGSGVVELDDGSTTRIGYAGQNGRPYFAIGRELIRRGELTKETVSMQSIRAWMAANPDQADALMNTNESYVFFRETGKEGAVGAEGVVLTPGHSLAVDRTRIPYGVPIWVDIAPPVEGEMPLQRLMVAQDTGGAIRGAVRGDVFWGHGERAEYLAGHMQSEGEYWLLLPRSVDIEAINAPVALP